MSPERTWERHWAQQHLPGHRRETDEFYALLSRELKLLFEGSSLEEVLEIGCGNGALYTHLGFDQIEFYRGVDCSQAMIDAFRQEHPEVDLVVASGEDYLDDRRYDLVFSSAVVQYFDAEMTDMHVGNARKMLQPGGVVVCACIPWRPLRWAFSRGEFHTQHRRGVLRSLAIHGRRMVHDRMGFWHDTGLFRRLAEKYDMEVQTFGSLCYPYRFHAVLRRPAS